MSSATAKLESLLGSACVGELYGDAGLASLPLALPTNEDEAAEVMHMARVEGLRVLPLGLGTKLRWCNAPQRADLALSTRELRGVVAYEPGDGTLTARAGSRMDELASAVARGGHRLTPDVPRSGEATLGGVLGAGQSGADRLRFGPTRHHVLGTRALLANGELTKSGGRLVKNVTGYDLHRLYCGSHGTLCVIVEATLRLFPLAEERALGTVLSASLEEALASARRVLAADAKPTSVWIENLERPGEPDWRLAVLLEGRREVLSAERAAVGAAEPALAWIEGEEARATALRLRDLEPDAREGAALHLAAPPSELAASLDVVAAALRTRARPLAALLQPGVATADVAIAELDADALSKLVTELRAKLERAGTRVAVRGLAPSAARALDPLGEPTAALPLMHRLRHRLDPEGRFATGRFHGGL